MRTELLDGLITNLGRTLILDPESFEQKALNGSLQVGYGDLDYLQSKFHHPPPVDGPLEKDLKLGQWLAACQYACFELMYNLEPPPIEFLKAVAFGEYDWTQATALEVICRLYATGKLDDNIIEEIDCRLPAMRFETLLYLARALLKRSEKDKQFEGIIKRLTSDDFQEAMEEVRVK